MIIDLGLVDFNKAYVIQKETLLRRKLDEIEDTLIFAEHPPVFTLGRTARKENLLVDELTLLSKGMCVVNVDRGGDITYHGPGQLMIYPIIDLGAGRSDLHKYMRGLEEVVIRFLANYSIKAESIPGYTGVWVAGEKIASIGVGASNWITYHGIGLNINTDLSFFNMIYPCGLKDIKMTSLQKLLGKAISMPQVKKSIELIFNEVFNLTSQPSLVCESSSK